MSASKKHVLIVEDERPLASALHLKLQHEGHDTTIANDGKAALALLDRQVFDIVLLDLMMPEIDGFHVLEMLQERPQKPYIIVLSNLSQPEDEEKALRLGAKKYFIKSNTPLAEIVAEIGKA